MMNLKEAVKQLQMLFKENNVEPLSDQKFESAKLNDGITVVEWEGDLATGVIVNVIDANGKLPLPMGQYQLEDGTTFEIVDDMGTVDNVVMVDMPEDTVSQPAPNSNTAPVAQSESAPVSTPKRVIKSQVEEHVFNLEIEGVEPISVDFSSMFKKLEDENKELKIELSKAKEINKEMFSIVQKIAEEPMSKPTESKERFSVSNSMKSYKQSLLDLERELTNRNINN